IATQRRQQVSIVVISRRIFWRKLQGELVVFFSLYKVLEFRLIKPAQMIVRLSKVRSLREDRFQKMGSITDLAIVDHLVGFVKLFFQFEVIHIHSWGVFHLNRQRRYFMVSPFAANSSSYRVLISKHSGLSSDV